MATALVGGQGSGLIAPGWSPRSFDRHLTVVRGVHDRHERAQIGPQGHRHNHSVRSPEPSTPKPMPNYGKLIIALLPKLLIAVDTTTFTLNDTIASNVPSSAKLNHGPGLSALRVSARNSAGGGWAFLLTRTIFPF